ncbi:MAG TPA: diacylglycerol kinase family protein [Clostridia bacterium]|nr:diacylglycerol kinase family protein [Clostridia bacterium]
MSSLPRRSLGESFIYAVEGLSYAWWTQRNMRIHTLAALFVGWAGYLVRLGVYEWLFVLSAIDLVITAEMVNTAIEGACDLASGRYSPVARMAKNVAAGGVLVSAAFSVIVAAVVFVPKAPLFLEVLEGGAYRSPLFWIWILGLALVFSSVLVTSKSRYTHRPGKTHKLEDSTGDSNGTKRNRKT